MPIWAVRCFRTEGGRDLFDRDYGRQEDITGWCRPNGFDRLSGKYRALGKLRFKVASVQHRPLGFFGPERKTFTLLIWATERDGKFDPPDVRETALRRMAEVRQNPKR